MSETAIVILCIVFCVVLAAIVGKEIQQERRRSLGEGGGGCAHKSSS